MSVCASKVLGRDGRATKGVMIDWLDAAREKKGRASQQRINRQRERERVFMKCNLQINQLQKSGCSGEKNQAVKA